MSPPFYGDLNKKAKDVLNSGYHFGLMKLCVNLKTRSCICFNLEGQSKQEDGLISGALETKYTWEKYGICVSEKFNTDNELITALTFNKLYQGLEVNTGVTFMVKDGFKEARAGLKYANNSLAFTADVNSGPMVGASLVLGTKYKWYPAVQLEYDANEKKVTKANLALDYIGDDFALHTNVDNGSKLGGMIYQRVTERTEAGIFVNFNTEDNETELGIGAKYAIDKDASVCCRVNNAFQLGLGYKQKLRDGITMCLSTMIDAKSDSPKHKLGLSLEFQA